MEKMKEVNKQWYSRHEFSTYKTRAKINFKLIDESEANFDIYTTETDKDKIREAINGMLNRKKCITFEVVNYTTKEQDDAISKFIDETFDYWDRQKQVRDEQAMDNQSPYDSGINPSY